MLDNKQYLIKQYLIKQYLIINYSRYKNIK